MLEIAKIGNEVLKEVAKSIETLEDEKLQSFIDSLIATTIAANGVGIAAPQVSESIRLFIVASRPNIRYPQAPLMEPTVMINPEIVSHGAQIAKDWEGCLSVPGLRGLVPRYTQIEVKYCDRQGNPQTQTLTDFVARIFQHENDHLNGVLFIDRLESDADLYTEEEYQKIITQ